MINEEQAKRYCCEDISKIKNYAEAVADTRMWDCHHCAETDEVLTKKELIAQGRYWNRPASELIFLTRSAHLKLHSDKGTRESVRKACAENGRKCSNPVIQFTLDGDFVAEWPSVREASRQTSVAHSGIARCCRGERKSAGKFGWKYK